MNGQDTSRRNPAGNGSIIRDKHKLRILGIVALAGVVLMAADDASATISVAKRAKFTGRVSVTGKAAGTYTVWQSSVPGGVPNVDTGFPITVGAGGTGSVEIPNVASGTLLAGHNVTIGTAAGPGGQTPLTVTKATGWIWNPWFASVSPGMNAPAVATISQAVLGQGSTLLETWDTNSVFSLSLNPAEASWVNMGASIFGMGDLQVQMTQFTPQTIEFRVVSDPTFTTLDDVQISGVGMNVVAGAGGSVGIQFGYSGSTSTYIDGQFLSTFSGSGQYEYERLAVVPAPSGSFVLAAIGIGIMGRRRR